MALTFNFSRRSETTIGCSSREWTAPATDGADSPEHNSESFRVFAASFEVENQAAVFMKSEIDLVRSDESELTIDDI